MGGAGVVGGCGRGRSIGGQLQTHRKEQSCATAHLITALFALLALAVPASAARPPRSSRGRRLLQRPRRSNGGRQRRPLRRQGRPPQPADRRPDRHRTGLLPGRPHDRLRPRRRPLLGPPRRLRPAAADQRRRARLGARRLARTASSSSSSGGPAAGTPADLYTVGATGGGLHQLTTGADDDHERRLRGRRQVDRLRPRPRRARGGNDDLYSIPPSGARQARGLTRTAGVDEFAPRYFAGGIVFSRGESSPGAGRLRRRLHDADATAPR